MDKVHKVTDPQQAETSGAQCTTTTNWEKCVVCQETTQEVLHCPADLKHDRVGPGYTTLANNLMGFSNIGCLPKTIQLSRLDDGDGIETTFQHHKAKWHDSCRLKFNKSKLQRAEKRKASAEEKTSPLKKYTRQSKGQTLDFTATCFFCGEIGSGKSLHQASTFELDIRVRQCALKLQDKPLLAKLSAGDLIAQEAKYHTKCLISLYNKARDVKSDQLDINDINHGIAFAGLVSYIEEANADSTVAPMFKMADLSKLYIARLEQLGTVVSGRVHSTHLKDRILAYFPDMEAHSQGRDVVLVSKQDINSALRKACDYNADNDAVYLARAANIVRKDMFKMKTTFNGTFDPMCQKQSVPISLLSLVSMILNGPNIKDQSSYTSVPQSVISLSQLLMFNSYVRHRESPTATTAARHSQQRETPLPVYLGVMVHTKTRKRELVDTLFNLGLSISYDRVLKISTKLGNNICQYYEIENAICPPQLRGNLFTTSAIDNIDHNPSSTSAHDSFHGTGISLFQHPSNDASSVQRSVRTNPDNSDNSTKKTLSLLPESYTRVPPVAFIKQDQPVPKLDGPNKADCQLIPQAMQMEYRWLDQVRRVVTDGTLQEDETVSWAAYHGSQQPLNSTSDNSVTLTSLLPLFYDQAKSVAMIRHSIDVVKSAVDILNPGQVPIITVDQPLYTLAKQIQWTWPTIYGEDQIVVMFGGLHIEMAVLKVLGNLLEDSGWTSALTQAGIASSGTADSFQKASHVTRCRRAHQVTASSLYIIMQKSYTQYSSSHEDGGNPMPFQDWCRDRALTCPQFQFWYIILHLELAMLIYIRAIREANFRLYVEALTMITPWFFALDHTNYARWIPVHLRDMVTLELKHPSVFAEFLNGNFTVKKTARVFSTIAIDQAHEQNNAAIKGDGGAVGLTENPAALRRWMVCGPEMARVIGEFEASMDKGIKTDLQHHEQTPHAQRIFFRDVSSLTSIIDKMGNPFSDESSDLLVLDTRDIADPSIVDTMRKIENLGQEKYDTYVIERLVNQTKPIADPIKRNKLALFSRPTVQAKSRTQLQISSLKNDCSLFSRLYIVSQMRDGNLDEFFDHDNQACPPALSQMGQQRTGTKADIVKCLEELIPAQDSDAVPSAEVIILDGAAIVNMLRPGPAKTFNDYATDVFLPYIKAKLQHANRVDIVWDEYHQYSLKATTRSRRGKGVRRRVEPSSNVPRNWQEFLRIDENKMELFPFLATRVTAMDTDKQVISTHHTGVLCVQQRDVSGLSPCSHEEADTRIFLHVYDAVKQGYTKVSVRTVDTDVVILAVTTAQRIEIPFLWIAFGTGDNFRYIAVHEIARALGPERCVALPMFHAFTGCDTVSFFGGRGKKTAWGTWKLFDDVTPAFSALSSTPQSIERWLKSLERFVILLYDRTSNQECVNQCRKQLFTQKGRTLDGLPPTKAALIQHAKRAAYQAGHCWAQMMIASPKLPCPSEWGWLKNEEWGWKICWTTLPEAAKACRELL